MKVMTYDGTLPDGVMIASDTNPWVEVDGDPVNWEAIGLALVTCPCGEFSVVLPGVLESMDTPTGIQRCDACDIYPGDLDAALALAGLVGGVVKFQVEED